MKTNTLYALVAGFFIFSNLEDISNDFSKKNIESQNVIFQVLEHHKEKKSFILPNYSSSNSYLQTREVKTKHLTYIIQPEFYGYINELNTERQELLKNLADKCNSSCLYYPDEDGNIRVVEGIDFIYNLDGTCFGTFRGIKGWTLFDSEGDLKSWGRNGNDTETKPENLIRYDNCEGDR